MTGKKEEFDESVRDIYLYHRDDHYDVITSMKGFLCKNYYCQRCDQGYSNKDGHACYPTCRCCYALLSECPDPCQPTWLWCDRCYREFKTSECFERHRKEPTSGRVRYSVCQRFQRCNECKKVIDLASHKGKGRKLRRLVDHRCGEYWCSNCRSMVSENHWCYVQPIKERRRERVTDEDDDDEDEEVREGTFSFMFFDFEAMPLEDKHVVNLAVAMKVCDECEE